MSKEGYKKYECPNNLCRATNCFKHCNHCGKDIKWTNYLGDPYYYFNKKANKKVRLPYEQDDTVHRCMLKGTKDGKYYNKDEPPSVYKLDEYRTIRRWSGPVFKCDYCGRTGDLPVMLEHHKNDKQFDCEDKLMKQFFDDKPKNIIVDKKNSMDRFL